MFNDDFQIHTFQNRNIVIKGIGKLFYQDGIPISISVSELKKHNIEVSILHVADECMKNGWSAKTTINKLKIDFEEDILKTSCNFELLEKFCTSTYEEQRELIFQYLFNCSTSDAKSSNNEPLNWLRYNICK